MTLPKHDSTGLYTFLALIDEAKRRGYGARSFDIARGVYERRHGPCPFQQTKGSK